MVESRTKKIAILLIVIATIFVIALMFWLLVKVPRTIYVPSDYARIQWAVGNASAGDTIIVSSGTYYEHVIIDKSLTLLGENGQTIIDGNNTGYVVTITADDVTISGFTIKNSGLNWGESGIHLLNSEGCNISYNSLTNNTHGIWADFSSHNNLISDNTIYDNWVGIGIMDSSGNIITNNNIHSNNNCGMGLENAENTVISNNIAKNNEYGIWLLHSNGFTIFGNTLIDNEGQVYINSSDNNTFFHNNFINNTHQTEIINSASIWFYNFEGNYWTNYVGLDTNHDGIGDNSHIIDANNIDDYPLWGMFSNFTITWEGQLHYVTTISNSTISNFNFELNAISFDVTGIDNTAGFCRVCIPTALMNDNFTVYVDGVSIPYTLLQSSNATYNHLYFTYGHSTKTIVISNSQ